ncbi:MAG: tetratricopeptide repeat protein [Balneolaceae bacterium]|nr:tetratricopeptide repeat protein [Balneolaceae bacterium]
MKFLKFSAIILIAGFLVAGISTELRAQDQNYADAVSAFNKALENAKANQFDQAINMYNQAIALAEDSDHENAADIIKRTKNQLPSIYYQQAVMQYKNFQKNKNMASLEEALSSFQETAEIAGEYGNNTIQQKASGIVTQLLYTKSIIEFKSQNFSAALASLDQAIERNPNYAKAYYQKGIVIKNRDNESLEEALTMFDRAIEVGSKPAVNDNQIVRQAKNAARDELLYHAYQEMEDKNVRRSIELLNRALNYDSQSADVYYRLAEAHNKRANWQQAIEYANKALELEAGGRMERAKIFFELATALKAQGQKEDACSAYKNAAYGSFKSPAEHQMEYELKCGSSTR